MLWTKIYIPTLRLRLHGYTLAMRRSLLGRLIGRVKGGHLHRRTEQRITLHLGREALRRQAVWDPSEGTRRVTLR
jgi:hypothetical protein